MTWWTVYGGEVERTFTGECWTCADKLKGIINHVEAVEALGLSTKPGRIHAGMNSGYSAVGLAYMWGAARIILLGYDMQRGPNGESHHHGDHEGGLSNLGTMPEWARRMVELGFDLRAQGVEVINATRRTAITCFERLPIEDALAPGGLLRRSPGWPADRFSVVDPVWDGDTVVCIGGGTSLTQEQVALVRRAREADMVRVIAVNDAYLLASWADVNYFADATWWGWHKDRPEFVAFAGQKCSIANSGAGITDPAVHILRNVLANGLSLDQESLMTGNNSGYQSINLAVLSGARTVVLIGYDAREPAAGQPSHWFGEHPRVAPLTVYAEYRRSFNIGAPLIKAAGVTVLNASPNSAIECFRKVALEDALS